MGAQLPYDGPGELVQSLTYREAFAPTDERRSLTTAAPAVLRTVAGSAWALVSLLGAAAVAAVVVAITARVIGVLW